MKNESIIFIVLFYLELIFFNQAIVMANWELGNKWGLWLNNPNNIYFG